MDRKKEINGALGVLIAFGLLGLLWFKGNMFNVSVLVLVVSILVASIRWYLVKTK